MVTTSRDLDTLWTLHTCFVEAFHSAKQFYATLFAVHFGLYIYGFSYQLYNCLLYSRHYDLTMLLVKSIINFVKPMFVWVATTRVFARTDFSVRRVYCVDALRKTSRPQINNWMYACAHTNTRFSCGFFNIDVSLMEAVFNYCLLYTSRCV